MIIAGNRIYEKCSECNRLVQINKRFFGTLHICLSPEEIARKREAERLARMQRNYLNNPYNSLGALGGKALSQPQGEETK